MSGTAGHLLRNLFLKVGIGLAGQPGHSLKGNVPHVPVPSPPLRDISGTNVPDVPHVPADGVRLGKCTVG